MSECKCERTPWQVIRFALLATVLLVAAHLVFDAVYENVRGPIEGSAAVKQLEDDDASYVAGRVVTRGVVVCVEQGLVIVVLAWVWLSVLSKAVSAWDIDKKDEEKGEASD